jgi:hypothetical protein
MRLAQFLTVRATQFVVARANVNAEHRIRAQ